MPSGYTQPVRDGETTTFRAFARDCMRAFDSRSRDLSRGEYDPDETINPDTAFYASMVDEARARYARAAVLLHDEPAADLAAEVSYNRAMRSYRERRESALADYRRYRSMLDKVEAYTPPTAEHANFKQFMESQLRESIDFDCGWLARDPEVSRWYAKPERQTGKEYAREEFAAAERSLDYAQDRLKEVVNNAAAGNLWLKAALASIETHSEAVDG